MRQIKMAPSKVRILSMTYPVLIEHYSLIQLKQSSLPSTQRKRVKERIEFLLHKGKITQEQLNKSLNNLIQNYE